MVFFFSLQEVHFRKTQLSVRLSEKFVSSFRLELGVSPIA